MRESRTYGSGRGACHEMHVPTATTAGVHRAVLLGSTGSILGCVRPEGASDCADEVTLSRKGGKSRTQGRKLRLTGTKAKARGGPVREPRAELEQQLEACRRELAEARARISHTTDGLGKR